jgi:hypothetical protein
VLLRYVVRCIVCGELAASLILNAVLLFTICLGSCWLIQVLARKHALLREHCALP